MGPRQAANLTRDRNHGSQYHANARLQIRGRVCWLRRGRGVGVQARAGRSPRRLPAPSTVATARLDEPAGRLSIRVLET
jgi:hypothetical protein